MHKFNSRIVIVDDTLMIPEILRESLLSAGYSDIILFSDPVLARAYLMENKIDILITDYQMPEINGLQLLEAAPDAKAKFLMSGNFENNPQLQTLCIQKNAVPIHKPFQPQTLIEMLENFSSPPSCPP